MMFSIFDFLVFNFFSCHFSFLFIFYSNYYFSLILSISITLNFSYSQLLYLYQSILHVQCMLFNYMSSIAIIFPMLILLDLIIFGPFYYLVFSWPTYFFFKLYYYPPICILFLCVMIYFV